MSVADDYNRKQRRILNPAFGAAQLKELSQIAIDKAVQMRDIWKQRDLQNGGSARLDVLSGIIKMTYDIIGFGYHINALSEDEVPNEINVAFQGILRRAKGRPSIFPVLKYFLPPLRYLPTSRMKRIATARAAMNHIEMDLIAKGKAEILTAAGGVPEKIEKNIRGRDVLALLLKENMAVDVPGNQRMSDEDVLAQIPASAWEEFSCGRKALTSGLVLSTDFLWTATTPESTSMVDRRITLVVAQLCITSSAAAWALYALSQLPAAQEKLCVELRGVNTENPRKNTLEAPPYLDAVVREIMRLYAPVPAPVRSVAEDAEVPLSNTLCGY
ncbi:uncharacterized protein FIBRA_05565 [Fibroporia radiculosa]|uniref:Cytochrome P450 n=1 Tax=Fibroporia radiculosa TaxID=599839 RepID=J4HXR5_9APHY|nr:uncharacterized protein FIBRA_05565 [Fibroporia radiculosa]CCM03432.1 predicted protein [Fibroporia radiculosa]